MMNRKKNFKTVLVLLILAASALLLIGLFSKGQPARRILFPLAIGVGLAALIQCFLYAINPGLFRDKRRPS
jgi:hypothetical protein